MWMNYVAPRVFSLVRRSCTGIVEEVPEHVAWLKTDFSVHQGIYFVTLE